MRIFLVDDNDMARRSIRSLLSSRPDWELCGEAADGLEAVEKAQLARPDAVLMDISMPRMNGLEATRIILQALPGVLVILISQNDPAVVRQQAAECGASGWIMKDALASDLLPCIQKVLGPLSGRRPPPPRARGQLAPRPFAALKVISTTGLDTNRKPSRSDLVNSANY